MVAGRWPCGSEAPWASSGRYLRPRREDVQPLSSWLVTSARARRQNSRSAVRRPRTERRPAPLRGSVCPRRQGVLHAGRLSLRHVSWPGRTAGHLAGSPPRSSASRPPRGRRPRGIARALQFRLASEGRVSAHRSRSPPSLPQHASDPRCAAPHDLRARTALKSMTCSIMRNVFSAVSRASAGTSPRSRTRPA